MSYNIRDAYLMFKHRYILLVSITPGLNLSLFENLFINDLKLKPFYYIDKDINKLPTSILNTTNYDKLNKDINDELQKYESMKNIENMNVLAPALVIFAYEFNNNKILFPFDSHIHLYLSDKNSFYCYLV